MSFFDILKGSLATLKTNKLRTLLTMLGIIIGISSVIAMWAIGNGGRESVLGDLKKIGYGKFTVTIDYKNENFKYKDYFTLDTVKMLKVSNKFKSVAVSIEDRFRVLKDNRPKFAFGDISTEDFEKISPVTIVYGRNFLPFEYDTNEKVITIDNMSAKNLYGSAGAALGQYLEISKDRKKTGHSYKIVGVYKSPYEAFDKIFGEDDNFPILFRMPYKTYSVSFNQDPDIFDNMIIEAKNGDDLATAMVDAKALLEFNKNVKDLYITNAVSSDIESFDKILSTLSLFVTLAASISLLVGGIGVMNIMLVTVVERTKEIGILI